MTTDSFTPPPAHADVGACEHHAPDIEQSANPHAGPWMGLDKGEKTMFPKQLARFLLPLTLLILLAILLLPSRTTIFAQDPQDRWAGVVSDEYGAPLAATVTINGTQGQASADGSFELYVPRADDDRYVIDAQMFGYVPLSQIHIGTAIETMQLTLKEAQRFEIDPEQEASVEDERGTQISIPANSLVDAEGNPATGPLQLFLYTYDLTQEEMVGDMSGLNSEGELVSMESVGAFYAQFTDADGNEYNLAPDAQAEISIPVDPSLTGEVTLWSYGQDQGLWVEEGETTQANERYVGSVSHFSYWNFDVEKQAPACIKLTVDPWYLFNNSPIKMKAVLNSPTRIRFLNITTTPNVLINLPANTNVDFFTGHPSYLTLYATVNTGAPWGGTGVPPHPYDDCYGTLHIDEPMSPGAIHGMAFDDLNGDGVRDDDELGLPNSGILLQGEDSTVVSAVTDDEGNYSFTDVEPGTYTVNAVLQPGWELTFPLSPTYTVDLLSGQVVEGIDFGIRNLNRASIHGMKFHDLNGDGVKDADELGLPDWSILLEHEDGTLFETTTDDEGNYWFMNLPPGSYTVSEVQQDGWDQTFPASGTHTVLLDVGQVVERIDFGNWRSNPALCAGAKPTFEDSQNPIYASFTGSVSLVTGSDDPVLTVFDLQAPYVFYPTDWSPPKYSHSTWTKANLGTIFGLTLDATGNIYVTATSAYWSDSASGRVYKIDGTTGAISTFATLPNDPSQQPALGNITYDQKRNQFFVTNHEDGLIYRLDSGGNTLNTYDHGVDGRTAAVLPTIPDDDTPGFTQLGRRLWGIEIHGNRLYYSVWWEDQGRPNDEANEIWSVALTTTGDFVPSSAQLEIYLPTYSGNYSNPVSDISFSPSGNMLLAEHSMSSDTRPGAHQSRVLEYAPPGSGWTHILPNYEVGGYSVGDNSAGGVDYDYASGHTVATGDALRFVSSQYVYGLQLFPSGTTLAGSVIIDLNGITQHGDKTEIGDVEIPCPEPVAPAEIHGLKFLDLDGDGIQDPNEPGIPGWPIRIRDADGVVTDTITDLDGHYWFMDLTPGKYNVMEDVLPGWVPTTPPTVRHTYEITAGQVITEAIFGNTAACEDPESDRCEAGRQDDFNTSDGPEAASPSPELLVAMEICSSGPLTEFDVPANNQCFGHTFDQDSGDSCLSNDCLIVGATVTIHMKVTGCCGSTDSIHFMQNGVQVWGKAIKELPEAGGSWNSGQEAIFTLDLANLPADGYGTTNILATLQDGDLDVMVADDTMVDYITLDVEYCCDCNQPGEIHGMKFHDLNGNGVKDPGEPGLAGWTILLKDEDGNVISTVTDDEGNYWFMDLPPGTYTVAEWFRQPGWVWQQTMPATGTHIVELGPGEVIENVDFGNWQEGKDDYCVIRWDDLFLARPGSGNTLRTKVHIYNTSTTPQKAYDLQLIGLPAGTDGTVADGPTTFYISDTLPISVNPTAPGEVRIGIDYPEDFANGIPGPAQFQAIVTNLTTGSSFGCQMKLWPGGDWWLSPVDRDIALIRVDVPQAVDFTLTNVGETAGSVDFNISAMSPHWAGNSPIITLNGLPPSETVSGTISLDAGETTTVTVDVMFTEDVPLGVSDILFAIDVDGDGEPDAITSSLVQVQHSTSISDVRTTNVRDVSFTVSWLTDLPDSGEVHYGTDPANLNLTAYDDRGAATSDDTHYVSLDNLFPNTTYYFDVVSGGTTDDNGGAHYMQITGATLGLPSSDTIYGQVAGEDGSTPAVGSIVYITLEDADGAGSSGQAAALSALVDNSGYWSLNLGNARRADLSSYFEYSSSGDGVGLEAQGAADGVGCERVDTAADSPATDIVLNVSNCTIIWPMSLQIGWNHISLPVDPITTSLTAEDVCDDINAQGGSAVEIDRWHAGGWDGHICGLAFNDFELVLGSDYFIKSSTASSWTIEGYEVTEAVPLDLQVGWTSIGIPHTDAYTASSLCDDIIAQGVTAVEIDRWYTGGWDGHICGLPFNDFNIERGAGYFVKTSSAGTVTPTLPATPLQQPAHAVPVQTVPVGQLMPVRELRVGNLSDSAVTLSWMTDKATTGYVLYGDENRELAQVALEVRGAAVADKTHYVTLTGLKPATSYDFQVVSGAPSDHDTLLTITTAPTLESLPASDTVYGQVYMADGVTPATSVLVYLTLQDADGTGDTGEATLLSALVDENGYWQANLGNAREAPSGEAFTYSETGDEVVLTVPSGTAPPITTTLDTSDLRPATPLILEQQGTLLYFPLISNK